MRQVTAKNRYACALAVVTDWCRTNRHRSIDDQHAHLSAMMRGHDAYYGTSGNYRRLSWYADEVASIWNLAYAPSLEAPGRCYHPFATTDTPTAVGFAICY